MIRGPYTIDALLQAQVDLVMVPRYRGEAWRAWFQHLVDVLGRCFGVSLDPASARPEDRERVESLVRVLRALGELPYPTQGALEAGLVLSYCHTEFRALFKQVRDVRDFYWRVARELAAELWGDLGYRSGREVAAAGLDVALEPVVDPDDP
jgi:beta-glucosidase-like glycosyl hydrolase